MIGWIPREIFNNPLIRLSSSFFLLFFSDWDVLACLNEAEKFPTPFQEEAVGWKGRKEVLLASVRCPSIDRFIEKKNDEDWLESSNPRTSIDKNSSD